MKGLIRTFPAHSIVCREGDQSSEIFYLFSGKLLVCTSNGTQIKAISRISEGEFIGELSFFDGQKRSAHVITLEDSEIVTFPKKELYDHLPIWHLEIHKNLTKKIRFLDEIINQSTIRKSKVEENKPLSIDEQRKILELLSL